MCMFGVHHSILFVCVYIAIYLSRERDCSILSCAKIIYKYVCFNLISVLLFEQIDVHITPGAHASEEAGNGSVHSIIHTNRSFNTSVEIQFFIYLHLKDCINDLSPVLCPCSLQ